MTRREIPWHLQLTLDSGSSRHTATPPPGAPTSTRVGPLVRQGATTNSEAGQRQQTLSPHSSGGWRAKLKGSAGLEPPKASLAGHLPSFLLHPHRLSLCAHRPLRAPCVHISPLKDRSACIKAHPLMAPVYPIISVKIPSPDTVIF